MALSVIVIPGNGVTKQFSIPFSLGYLENPSFVTCRVGNEVDGTGAPVYRNLTFLSGETVVVSGAAPGVGVPVRFERTVPRDELLVNYEDDAIINEENMNTSQLQLIMLVQEIADGRFTQFQSNVDLAGNRFTNMGDPIDAQDGATKAYVDLRYSSNLETLNATIVARDAAIAARNQASTFATNSSTSATNSANSATASATSASTSAARATDAFNYRNNAYAWASNAEDVLVDDGTRTGYSSYHWAKKAEGFSTGASYVQKAGDTMTGPLITRQSTTSGSGFRLPPGNTPTTVVNGDIWTTANGFYYGVNGATRQSYDAVSLPTMTAAIANAGTDTTVQAITAAVLRSGITNAPVGTATQTALNLKANNASPALTGTPTAPTAGATVNTTQIATMAAVQAAIGANVSDSSFTSGQLTWTAGGTLTIAHGLGVSPSRVDVSMVCVVADKEYAVGDIISTHMVNGAQGSWGIVANMAGTTNVVLLIGAQGIASHTKTGRASDVMTPASWRLVVRIYK